MRKVLLSIFGVIIVIAVLAGAGFAGYRVGYEQGVHTSGNDNTPPLARPENRGRDEMPRFNFGRDSNNGPERAFDRGFPRGYFRMMPHSRGFGMFSLFRLLTHLAIWVLLIVLVDLLFTRSGWRLSITKQPIQDTPATIETEAKPPDSNSENE